MLKSRKRVSSGEEDDLQLDLLPGFRFHPTDEELITHYLSRKVLDCSFRAHAIGEVDLNKFEPWELPRRAKMGEKEWYFFCVRYPKYPTGLRTNRATEAGYWKATGKDKEIYRMKTLLGMKKTLVFYKGRAPKGLKTDWVMHEYRLDGELSQSNLQKIAKFEKEWVICRVFEKSHGGNKTHMTSMNSAEFTPSILVPPLTDSSHTQKTDHATISSHDQVTEPMNSVKEQDDSTLFGFESYDSLDVHSNIDKLLCVDYDEESLVKMLLENCGSGLGEPLNLVESLWK